MPQSNEERMERVFDRMLLIAEGAEYPLEQSIQAAGMAAAMNISMSTAKVLDQQAENTAAEEVREIAREQERVERHIGDKARMDVHMKERAARLKVINTIMDKDNPTPEDLEAINEISARV